MVAKRKGNWREENGYRNMRNPCGTGNILYLYYIVVETLVTLDVTS